MTTIKGAEDYPFYFGASARTLQLVGDLRRAMTEAEKMLWQRLRDRQLNGFRFRRQHPRVVHVTTAFIPSLACESRTPPPGGGGWEGAATDGCYAYGNIWGFLNAYGAQVTLFFLSRL